MNLVIDLGNTRGKAGLFTGRDLTETYSFQSVKQLAEWATTRKIVNVLVSSVATPVSEIQQAILFTGEALEMTPNLPIPIANRYATPATLGVDRLAAACGAIEFFPGKDILVVDAGTCVNYEFLDGDGNYWGGAISPGLRMRFESMHHFTARLPLIKPNGNPSLTGRTTEECMQSGVEIGMLEEIKGMISRYQLKYPNLRVVLCGGDAAFFENFLKPTIFVAPDLVLMGLNGILLHNVKN